MTSKPAKFPKFCGFGIYLLFLIYSSKKTAMNFTNEIASNRRNGQVSTFKEALEEMLRHSQLRHKFKQATLLASWQQMMGEAIAEKTLRLFIKEKVLYAEFSSSPLKAELLMAKAKIVAQLNKQAGEHLIDEVVFI